MSHTTKLEGITITDIPALQDVIKELNRSGIKCELLENQKPIAFFQNQVGMDKVAPYVIRCAAARYDIALYPKAEGKGFDLSTDLYANHVATVFGAPDKLKEAPLGKLYQLYGVHAATRQAVRQGYTVSRRTKTDGTIQLLLGNIN